MVIEILGAIAADAAGESMHKSKEKSKLEATKDDPKEHAKILGEIEKRKERNNKMAVFLVGLFLFILFIQEPMVILVLFLAILWIFGIILRYEKTTPLGEEAEFRTDSKTNSGTISPSERQALMSRKCSVPGCKTGNFRMTDYCHKHQDHIPSNSEPETEEEEVLIEAVAEQNWWEDEN